MIAVLFTYPNDFIASRIMYQGKEKQYNGYMDAVKKIIQNEGFFALYTGLASSMSRFVLGSVITFSTYEMMKRI
jgi:solute carrier family 25 (mitochondrial citrate transporter), member 1